MTIKQLASELAKREGKKSQARIGDIREILSLLVKIMAEEESAGEITTLAAISAQVKKKAKKKK